MSRIGNRELAIPEGVVVVAAPPAANTIGVLVQTTIIAINITANNFNVFFIIIPSIFILFIYKF